MLADVVKSQAITAALTQAKVRPLHNENGNHTTSNHFVAQNAREPLHFGKRRQSSSGIEDEPSPKSFLSMTDHPTMANIRMQGPPLPSDACTFQRDVINRVGRVSKQAREPVFQGAQRGQTPSTPKTDCSVCQMQDNLSINIPSNVKTINLSTDARSSDCQENVETAEIRMFLHTVTAKLDAIIRHFNVPFSDIGSMLPTQILGMELSQHTHARDELETEKQSENMVMSHLLCKQSPSAIDRVGVNRKTSPMIQRPTDGFLIEKAVDVDTAQSGSFLPVNNNTSHSKNSRESPGEQTICDLDIVRLPEEIVVDLHSKSLNRGNFAKHLVFQLFSPEERKGKNCFGRRAGLQSGPKAPLDPVRLQYVREKVFQYYPCEPDLEETIWRRQCVIAVDTALRGENRPHKKSIELSSIHLVVDNQL